MKLVNAYWSPTGGTEQYAKAIAEGTGLSVLDLDLTGQVEPLDLGAEDVLLCAVPSFGGRAPAQALEKLKALRGEHTRAIAVTVYGAREFEDTLAELSDALTGQGFAVCAAGAFVARHSIVPAIAQGRPNAADLAEAAAFGAKAAKQEHMTGALPGNRPYKSYGGLAAKPAAGDLCTLCGTCAKGCPVGAIPRSRPNETDNDKCVTCMRCVAVCPTGARALPGQGREAIGTKLRGICDDGKANRVFY